MKFICFKVFLVVTLAIGKEQLAEAAETSATNTFDDTGHHPMHETYKEHPELRSIGRIFSPNLGDGCTATIVAPKVILTAAHCFFDENGELRDNRLTFVTGADTLAEGVAVPIRLDTAVPLTTNWKQNPGRDIAFATLKKELDSRRFPPLQLEPLKDFDPFNVDLKVSLTSYPGSEDARPRLPMTESGCLIPGVDVQIKGFTHDCSTTFGSSGAPLYIIHDGRIMILGVHQGADHGNAFSPVHYSEHYANRAVDAEIIKTALSFYLAGRLRPDTL